MRLDGMAPGLAFIAGAAISAGAFFFIRDNAETEAKLRFEREASDAKHVIEARIGSYLDVLSGLAALLATSGTASHKDFERYVTALDLPRRYPGFSYVSPMHESQPGFGLHLLSSGRPIDPGDGKLAALALRLPVYRADAAPGGVDRERARYVGSVGAGFRLQESMQGALEEATLRFMRFKLYDAGAAQGYDAGAGAFGAQRLLFDSGTLLPEGEAGRAQEGASLRTMLPMEIGGRIWQIQFSAPREALIKGADRALPWLVLAGGLLASLALSATLYSLAASRLRALRALGELRFVATHDALTGLANRVLFHDLLTHALRRAARHRSGVAVLFLDLDRFKVVNDTLGHAAGDQLLRECARRLKDSLRESDVVARLGGDEFVVLMEDYSSSRDAVTVADKILRRMAAPLPLEGQEFTPAASIGISVFPDDGTSVETLLKHADIAMYRAKARGRNNHQFYSAQGGRGGAGPLVLEASLRAALERGELALEYQPKFDLRSGSLAGVEALLRWQHPELGVLLPASFVALAEQAGLVAAIGDWTLRRACEQSRAWRQAGLPAPRIAIEISPQQFARKSFLAEAGRILEAAGAPAQSLEFEVTESMLMHHPEPTTELLRGLSGMGIAITLDDFGSGYSSLAYLQSLPLAALKIDGAFVKGIPGDANGMAIAEGVIALGHSLKLTVVAQDVETAEQQEFLIASGCDQAQGSLLCRPLPAQDMTAFLRRGREDAGEPWFTDPAASSL